MAVGGESLRFMRAGMKQRRGQGQPISRGTPCFIALLSIRGWREAGYRYFAVDRRRGGRVGKDAGVSRFNFDVLHQVSSSTVSNLRRKEEKRMATKEQVKNWFTYHSPTPQQNEAYQELRDKGLALAETIAALS